jgi:hypothetical protein
LAIDEGAASPCRPVEDRLAAEAPIWSHRTLSRANLDDFVFSFHEDEEIGPKMLARIAKRAGLTPEDL